MAADGAAFGKGKQSEACVAEAVARLKAKNSFADELAHKFFLRACLDAATRPPGYCDDVPPKSEILKTVGWALKQCTDRGLGNDQACPRLLQAVQEHCHEGAK